MAGLTRSDVEHVAFLARLRLTGEELDRLEGQLNHILDQYAKLSELDTSAIPPTAQTIELENILREDVAAPSLSVEDVLRNAKATEGDFIVVPPILGGDGQLMPAATGRHARSSGTRSPHGCARARSRRAS